MLSGLGADGRRGSYVAAAGGRRTHLVLEAMQAVVLDEEARLVELLGRVDLLHLRQQVVAHGLQLLLDVIMPCLGRHHEGNLPVLVAHCEVRLPQTRRVWVRHSRRARVG